MKRLMIHNPGWVTTSIFAVSALALCLVEGADRWRESILLFALLLTGAVISSGISATCMQERSREYLWSIQQIALDDQEPSSMDVNRIREWASLWEESSEDVEDEGFDEPDSTQRRRP